MGIGASIHELATSIAAVLIKKNNFALGNLIGSNIFNFLIVLVLVARIKEITIFDSAVLLFGFVWMIFIALMLGLFIYAFSKWDISVMEGVLFLLVYIAYFYYSIY